MAETKKKKSELIGAQAKPTTLDNTTKLDIDTTKKLIDNVIEAGIQGGLNSNELEHFTAVSNSRDQIYQLIDTMAADSSVSAIIKTYAEDVCEPADSGHIIWCEASDPNISSFINYLLNVMNADKHMYTWAYNLIKYGDVYLRLFRESDYQDKLFNDTAINNSFSAKTTLNEEFNQNFDKETLEESVKLNIHNTNDQYSYYVEMVPDPCTMFELTKFGKTYGFIETPNDVNNLNYINSITADTNNPALAFTSYKMKSSDVNVYQADDFVHACLEDNFTRFPESVNIFLNDEDYKNDTRSQNYTVRRGKSMLIDSYKVWREKSLLETAVLLNRLTKSSIIRNIQVEVGDMPKSKVQNTLRHVKELFEQKSAYSAGTSMSEYTNPGPVENNIFTATHSGVGAITVNAVGGDSDVKDIADIDWWNNKFYAAYGIPKAFFGYTDDAAGFNGGSSLSIISSTYSKGVKKVQNAMIQMLTDAINLFLINKGCRSYLNNFVLKMKTPLSQEEKDYREDLANRISAISNLQSLFGDIENKARRLEILKDLVGKLNYGDSLIQILDEEIADAELAAKEAAEAAEAEAAASAETELAAEAPETEEEESLGNSSLAPVESFNQDLENKTVLTEDQDLGLDDELPSPAMVNEKMDFTKNV